MKIKMYLSQWWFAAVAAALLVAVAVVFVQLTQPVAAYNEGDFVFTVKTDNPGQSTDTQFTIPVNDDYTYNYSVDCDGDGTAEHSGATGNVTCTYPSSGEYTVAISGQFPAIYFADTGDKLKILDIKQWGSQQWRSFEEAFTGAEHLTSSADDAPNLSANDISMSEAFYGAYVFNPDTLNWDTSNVTDMARMFRDARAFNGNVTNWDTGNVIRMSGTFQGAHQFNGDVSGWDVSKVRYMDSMFGDAPKFNRNLSSWDTSNVEAMGYMFAAARTFKGDVSTWNVEKVRTMDHMFFNAWVFSSDLSAWKPLSMTRANGIFSLSGMSRIHYDALLGSWSKLQGLPKNITLGVEDLLYSNTEARQTLIDTYSWTIEGDLYSDYDFFDPTVGNNTGSDPDSNENGQADTTRPVDSPRNNKGRSSHRGGTQGGSGGDPRGGRSRAQTPPTDGGSESSQGETSSPSPSTPTDGSGNTNTPSDPDGVAEIKRPALIKSGWDIPTASFVASHIKDMEKQPFDGVKVAPDDSSLRSRIFSDTLVPYDDIKDSVAAMKGVSSSKLKHNMLALYIAPVGDLDDDAAWSVATQNVASFTKAAKWAGFKGIMFDDESYFGETVQYGKDCRSPRTLQECQTLAQQRGKQVMDAMRHEWSDIDVISLHGPTAGTEQTGIFYDRYGLYYDVRSELYSLTGPFNVGMIESAMGSDAKYVSGGEIYEARTKQDFDVAKYWTKHGIIKNDNYIPSSMKAGWPNAVSVSFGIYDESMTEGASEWGETIKNAMTYADDYVWLHTEKYNWWNTPSDTSPAPPQDMVDATRRAVDSFGNKR